MVSVASAAGSARAALSDAERVLARAGCDTARLDAELLLAEVLDLDRATLSMDLERPIEEPAGRRFAALVARREAREPAAYILGRRDFRHLTLHVDRRVLVPRPESELLVEAALELPARARVVDVGTGSGAVALAAKQERPDLDVTGTDLSAAALAVARGNGRRLGLDVRWRQADLLAERDQAHDAVLANLPYVAEAELDALAPEISRYEPRAALCAGPDGLALLRRLCTQLDGVRVVALEVGVGQAHVVGQLLTAAGFASVQIRRDLAAIDRVVVGRRA
jgi:release factor glutamine methyltransferase